MIKQIWQRHKLAVILLVILPLTILLPAVGVIDESAHAKQGAKTPGVHRQYCGETGKIDNCVVGVHLLYAVGFGCRRHLRESRWLRCLSARLANA